MPLAGHDRVLLGHGGGGRLTADLVEHLFLPALGGPDDGSGRAAVLADAAVLEVQAGAGSRLALTTDSFVVRPLFFPGGDIGSLAVHGTVNDLAMVGARPRWLSAAFVVEEGLALEVLGRVADRMGAAAQRAGVRLVAGDTKVVERGRGDGLYVTTAGVGVVPHGVSVSPERARPGDAVVVSGPIGRHGIAVLSERDGLEFATVVESDTAPLHDLVAAMLAAGGEDVHVLRDPTRGGLAAALNELAAGAGVGVEIEERAVPVPEPVRAACGLLGLDPFTVANEGVLVGFVAPSTVDAVMAAMRQLPVASAATVIGRVTAEHPGVVVARTPLGTGRIVDLPVGEQLPRIC